MNQVKWMSFLTILAMAMTTFFAVGSSAQTREEFQKKLDASIMKMIATPVEDLIEAGISRVGDVDLQILRERIADVRFEISDAALLTQGRVGHRYNVETKTITLSSDIFSSSNEIEILASLLHEAEGAAGFKDEKSEITSVILAKWMLLKDPASSSKLKSHVRSLSSQIKLDGTIRRGNPTSVWQKQDTSGLYMKGRKGLELGRALSSGGVTEGGGGGDPSSITLKTVLLTHLIKVGATVHEINFFINRVNFETYLIDDRGAVALQCPIDRKGFEKAVQQRRENGVFNFYIPRWCALDAFLFTEASSEIQKLARSQRD